MTATSPDPKHTSHYVVSTVLSTELRKKAERELKSSIRRGQYLGLLSGGQIPWQILLACIMQEPTDEECVERFQSPEFASGLQFDDRWLLAVQEAGLIRIDSSHRISITNLGVQVVAKCLGD